MLLLSSVRDDLATPTSYGVEVDLRDYGGAIRLAHDPFVGGERLEDFLREYRHAGFIFNVKSNGRESAVIQPARGFGIEERS